ncbi:hypothetical protein [uncultured Roseibium sp.]|uniref:hypothetical protein n=1 Tax=uncultured Roseibium sp. TaxID=1936171 RepID=UPI003217F607
MPEKRAKTSTRQVVKETLTLQRLSLLSWAFAAILFGSVGFASLKFGRETELGRPSAIYGQILPPGGDVTTTASIGTGTGGNQIGLMPTVNGRVATGADEINTSQIETLQREVVALRRRLSALAEQNVSYSRRIAALEEELAQGIVADADSSAKAKAMHPAPVPGKVTSAKASSDDKSAAAAPAAPLKKAGKPEEISDKAVQKRIESVPAPETMAGNDAAMRMKLQNSGQAAIAGTQEPKRPVRVFEPVRIAELPKPGPDPITTGSITPTDTPVAEDIKPPLITPSKPVGRSTGAGTSLINHSDFGAVVGRYATAEKAAEAWNRFEEQNEERMKDLRPIISKSDLDETYALLVGPFGNAANAAVACLRLLEVTGTCHPALYIGMPLPELEISKAN